MSMFPKHARFIFFVSSWLCKNKMVRTGLQVRVFLICNTCVTGINLNAEIFLAVISSVYSKFPV